jgi:23S rRNA G2069 N7-methylase RlmK/C1962 C5-methylase RlmI
MVVVVIYSTKVKYFKQNIIWEHADCITLICATKDQSSQQSLCGAEGHTLSAYVLMVDLSGV